jgi:hypothetical protein
MIISHMTHSAPSSAKLRNASMTEKPSEFVSTAVFLVRVVEESVPGDVYSVNTALSTAR